MRRKPKVSLYIPCYNVEKYIGRCLASILKQTYPIEEILIIDDGSTDNTIKIASKYPVRIVRHSENRGLAAARNTAIANAKNEFIASLDADCVASPTWLEKLMDNFVEENVAGVGGRLIEKYTSSLGDKWRSVHLRQDQGEIRKSVDALPGCNCVYRKSVLKKVGGYNERYKTNFEDIDLSYRVRAKNYKLIYTPDAIVFHMCRDSVSSAVRRAWRFGFADRLTIRSPAEFLSRYLFDIGCSLCYCIKDLHQGNYDLLLVDIIVFTHWLRCDWENFRSRKKWSVTKGTIVPPKIPEAIFVYMKKFFRHAERGFRL